MQKQLGGSSLVGIERLLRELCTGNDPFCWHSTLSFGFGRSHGSGEHRLTNHNDQALYILQTVSVFVRILGLSGVELADAATAHRALSWLHGGESFNDFCSPRRLNTTVSGRPIAPLHLDGSFVVAPATKALDRARKEGRTYVRTVGMQVAKHVVWTLRNTQLRTTDGRSTTVVSGRHQR